MSRVTSFKPITNPTKFRGSIAGSLDKFIADTLPNQGIHLEHAIYQETLKRAEANQYHGDLTNRQVELIYTGIVRFIFTNWEDPLKRGGAIKDHIHFGRITNCEQIAALNAWDIRPDIWDKTKREIEQQENLETPEEEALTSDEVCENCGSTRCTYALVQTRSADEETTQFFKCLDCNKHWRKN